MALFAALAGSAGQAQGLVPTLADVPYGSKPLETLDVYLAASPTPTPVVVEMHPGGWTVGAKSQFAYYGGIIETLVQSGVSVVSINYPLAPQDLYPQQNLSAQRAVQFVRSQALAWNLDATRVGAIGISAGAHLALWVALSPDASDPSSPDPVVQQSSRLRCVVGIQAPTDLTDTIYKQDFGQFPAGSEVWNYFGVASQQEYEAIADATKQAASPRHLAGLLAANANVSYLGIYAGVPSANSSSSLPVPVADLHNAVFGLLQLEALEVLGAADASVYISPFLAPELQMVPCADLAAEWLALRLTRAKVRNSGFGVAGCYATQFQSVNSPPMVGNAGFALRSFDAYPGAVGLLLLSDAKDPNGGTDFYGVGVPLLVDPFTPNLLGANVHADASGACTLRVPIPNDPSLQGLRYWAQTVWVWPDPSVVFGCTPSPIQLSTTNLLDITIQ